MIEKQPARAQIPVTFSHGDKKQMDLFNILNDFCETEGMNRNQLIRNAIRKELIARGLMKA
ncbi:hypothetical protein [Roseateles sp. PN1]|uniref:hypothetical protein n=1 Tax=Roseateles sp. PN1 TaxID=3137372 RepID=UPI0031398CA2